MTFKIDSERVLDLQNDLENLSARALPFAVRNTLDQLAFKGRLDAREELDEQFTLRNRWTINSVRFARVGRGLDVNRMESRVGSDLDYLLKQETGGVKRANGRGVALATSHAAGEGRATTRRRLPRGKRKIQRIQLSTRKPAANNKQALLIKMHEAARSSNKFFYHQFDSGSKGIFEAVGGRKTTKRGWPEGARLEMVYDLSRSTVNTPRTQWLTRAGERTAKRTAPLYGKALVFQLKRLKSS